MHSQFCPYCGKKTPKENFCVYCGKKISNARICLRCHASIPTNASSCPFCTSSDAQLQFNSQQRGSLLVWISNNFRPSIFIIFLLSAYSITQLMIGSVFLFLLPDVFSSNPVNFALITLVTILISTVILIVVISKLFQLSFQKKVFDKNKISIPLLLVPLLMASIATIEIILTIIDQILDFINVDPSLSSVYDEYFSSPLNIFTFFILIAIIGPIFEELIFRYLTISTMLKHSQSNILLVCASALVFSISHTLADLIDGSVRYAILHVAATIILGIILAVIFLQWGLKYSIIFHSFWNIYSFIGQLLTLNGFPELLEAIGLVCIIITIILGFYLLYFFKKSLKKPMLKISLPTRSEFSLILVNSIFILTYESVLPLMLLIIANNNIAVLMIFFYQLFGFLIGIVLIDRDRRLIQYPQ